MVAISGVIRNSKYHFGVSSVKVEYNNSDYSFSDSSGYYTAYVPEGSANITFNASFYTPYVVTENSTSDSTINVNISFFLNPSNVNNPSITLDRAIPLLFFTLFLSWTLSSQTSVSHIDVHYYQLGTKNNNTLKLGAGSTFTFVNGILPGNKYVVYIEVILTDGQYIFSNGVEISYSNISFLALNVSIVAFIALAAYSASISIKKRARRKKAFKKLLEETYGSSKKWK
jgi:subtilase family serine protease